VADSQPVPGVRPLRAAVVFVILIFGIATGSFLCFQQRAQEKVSGTVRAQGTPLGSFAFFVDDCASGHAFVPGFFGAELRGRGFDLRVVGSGDDAQLWLFPPSAQRDARAGVGAIPIGKPNCARFDVLVDWAHVTVNRVNTVSGHVHVACTVGGGNVTADADFTRCAY
jgi:hypothetical protein